MKIFFCFSLLCLSLSYKAQIQPAPLTIPVEEHLYYLDNDIEIPDGAYIQDVNAKLDKFVGTWIGTYNNKTYEFQVEEVTVPYLGITQDLLLMRYKITDANGNIIENTLGLPNDSPYVIEGQHFSSTGSNYTLYYVGEEAECGQSGNLYAEVTNSSNLNEMHIVLEPYHDTINSIDCPDGETEHILPLEEIILNKQ